MYTSKKRRILIACALICSILSAKAFGQEDSTVNRIIKDLESAVSLERKTEARLRDELTQARNERDLLSKRLKVLESSVSEDTESRAKLNQQVAGLKKEKEQSWREAASLDKRLKDLEISLALNSKLLAASQEKIARLEKDNNSLERSLAEQEKAARKALSSEKRIKDLESAVALSSKLLLESKDQAARLQKDKASLAQSLKDKEKSTVDITPLLSKIKQAEAAAAQEKKSAAELKDKIALLQKDRDSLAQSLKDKEKASSEVVTLNKRIRELESAIDQDAKTNLELRDKLEKIGRERDFYAQAAKETQKQSLAQSQDKAKLSQDTASLNRKIAELQGVITRNFKTNQELENKLIAAQKDNEKLSQDALRARRKIKEPQPQAALGNQPLSEVNNRVARLEKEKDALVQSLKQRVAEAEIAKGKIEALEKDKTVLSTLLGLQSQGLRQPQGEKDLRKLAHLNLGYGFGLQGKTGPAIKEYRSASIIDPKDKDIHYNLGCLLSKEGRYKEAVEEYKLSLKGTPEDKEIYYNLAIIYAGNLKDVNTSRQYYQEFLALSYETAAPKGE